LCAFTLSPTPDGPAESTYRCPTDYILRSHGGSTAERDREWKPERNFTSRAYRKRWSSGRVSHSLVRRYLTHNKPPDHSSITNPRTAIISFLAAFFLISYALHEAKHELKLEVDELERTDSSDSQQHHRHHLRESSVVKNDTRVVQVCRFNSLLPPLQLLERCNQLCMTLTAAGFALEIMAILCFAWDTMGVAVSAFASALTLFCLVTSLLVVRPSFR
jgi:hypothetical protein